MSVDLISVSASAFKPQSANSGASFDKLVTGTPPTKDQPQSKTEPVSIVDQQISDKVSIADKSSSVASMEKDSKPAGVVSHVVVSYNQQGEMRTKFEDSRNNVVYQLPSEMVAKIQDLMTKSISTDIKG